MTRRQFAVLVGGALPSKAFSGTDKISETLRASKAKHNIPCVVAVFANANDTIYSGAFGKRDADSETDVTPASIFSIASMTKAITTTAAMQLVEQGKLKLDDPASKELPELRKAQVLTGFDPKSGQPMLRPPKSAITLRQLLSHTSGFVYPMWDEAQVKYEKIVKSDSPLTPLAFDPGTRWQYGTGVDWAGLMVEKLSGLTLEDYFQRNILQPLGMKDTSYILPVEKFDRLVGEYQRQADGSLKPSSRVQPEPPKIYRGGGGLYSTAPDYIRFAQMILRKGLGSGKDRILEARTVEMMASNQIGKLTVGKMKTVNPEITLDVDLHPGAGDKFGLGFLINQVAYKGGRSAGSLAWAGIFNTYYWIDPSRQVTGVIMMQLLPFADKGALAVLGDFERAAYASL